MKPAPFDYARPDSTDELVELLAEHGDDARIIAGGQSLMPMLNMRLVRPEVVVDIAGCTDLDHITETDVSVEVGALTTQGALGEWPGLAAQLPLIAQALPHVGHFQTRNRGTVCGSICHADPSSELPLCLALLEGAVELQSAGGMRWVKASDFQLGVLSTAKEPDEVATRAVFPIPQSEDRFAFTEFHHRHGDFAVVAVAARRRGTAVRLAVGGVADRPTVRDWEALDDREIDDALNDFAWDLGAGEDIHATARHRRHLVRHLGRRVIEQAGNPDGA